MEGFQQTFQTYKTEIENITDSVVKKKLLPFIGAGMSIPSGLPGWSRYLKEIIEKGKGQNWLTAKEYQNAVGYLEHNDLTRLAGFLYSSARQKFIQETKYHFRIKDESQIKGPIRDVINISSRFITTNLDEIIEILNPNLQRMLAQDRDDLKEIGRLHDFVFKLHGSLQKSSNWILTEDQYEKQYTYNEPLKEAFINLFATNTILFLGCSLANDPLLDIIKTLPNKNAYAIIAEPRDEAKIENINNRVRRSLGIDIIFLKNPEKLSSSEVYENQLGRLIEYFLSPAKVRTAESKREDSIKLHPVERAASTERTVINVTKQHIFGVRNGQKVQFLKNLLKIWLNSDFQKWVLDNVTTKLGQGVKASNVRVFIPWFDDIIHLRHAEFRNRHATSNMPAVQVGWNCLVGWVLSESGGDMAYAPCPLEKPFHNAQFSTDEKIAIEMAAPISFRGVTAGALLVCWTDENTPFDPEFLNKSSIHASIRDKWNQIKKSLDQFAYILGCELERMYCDSDNSHLEFRTLADECLERTDSDRGYIALWNEEGRLDYFRAVKNQDTFFNLYPTEGLCGRVLRSGTSVNFEDISKCHEAIISHPEYLVMMAIPIVSQGVTIGVIDMERRSSGYTEQEKNIIEKTAKKVAEIYQPDIHKIARSSAITFLGSDNLSEKETKDVLLKYVKFKLKQECGPDVHAWFEEPTQEEKDARWIASTNERIYLKIDGQVQTVLVLVNQSKHKFGKNLLDDIRFCSQLTANALKRIREYDSHKNLVNTLSELSNVNIKNTYLAAHLHWTVRKVNEILRATYTTLLWICPDQADLLLPGVSTAKTLYVLDPSVRGYAPGDGLTGYVFREKKTLLIKNLKDCKERNSIDQDIKWNKLISELPPDTNRQYKKTARSYLACPIIDSENHKILGVLRSTLEENESKPAFTDSDKLLLQSIASSLRPFLYHFLYMHRSNISPWVEMRDMGGALMNYHNPTPPYLRGLTYSPDEANRAYKTDSLLSIHLENPPNCNLNCLYCTFKTESPKLDNDIGLEKRLNIIEKARKKGARSVVFIGGSDFFCNKDWKLLLDKTRALELLPVVFTNGVLVTRQIADLLYASEASVIVKLDAMFDPDLQDRLSGKTGYNRTPLSTIEKLWLAGYRNHPDDTGVRIGITCALSKDNINEVPEIWKYCRQNGIYPSIKLPRPGSKSQHLFSLAPSMDEVIRLHRRLIDIDQGYGYEWPMQSPHACYGCHAMLYSVYVSYDGYLHPCAGLRGNKNINVKTSDSAIDEAFSDALFIQVKKEQRTFNIACSQCKYYSICQGCLCELPPIQPGRGHNFSKDLKQES